MKQYWLKNRYEDGLERWELTRGKFTDKDAVLKAYEARAKALGFEVIDAAEHEQTKFYGE